MPHVLVIHDSATIRSELDQALLAEGYTVVQADSAGAAVRELWQGSFDAALFGERTPGLSGATLEVHLKNLAPEIVTLPIGKGSPARLARKLTELLDGVAAA
ncbi:MAG: response regulator [Myxococcales bacterium]|nr:response regulator [Myxococcales bacterium]